MWTTRTRFFGCTLCSWTHFLKWVFLCLIYSCEGLLCFLVGVHTLFPVSCTWWIRDRVSHKFKSKFVCYPSPTYQRSPFLLVFLFLLVVFAVLCGILELCVLLIMHFYFFLLFLQCCAVYSNCACCCSLLCNFRWIRSLFFRLWFLSVFLFVWFVCLVCLFDVSVSVSGICGSGQCSAIHYPASWTTATEPSSTRSRQTTPYIKILIYFSSCVAIGENKKSGARCTFDAIFFIIWWYSSNVFRICQE